MKVTTTNKPEECCKRSALAYGDRVLVELKSGQTALAFFDYGTSKFRLVGLTRNGGTWTYDTVEGLWRTVKGLYNGSITLEND